MVIEAVTGQDYRDVIRDKVLAPLGLDGDIFVGVPTQQQSRCADTYAPEPRDNSAEFRAAGLPSGGGFATARGMAAFYQMLLGKGRLGNVRLFSPRLIAYVSRNHTGERGDEQMNGIPMHRGLGPHVRGESDRIRGLGTIGAPVDVRPWRRRVVVFLGRSGERRVVHLSDQFRVTRSVAFGAAGSRGEPGARGDRLIRGMPYASNDELPPAVGNHLPPHAQDIFREAFNHAWQEYGGDEERGIPRCLGGSEAKVS